MFAREDWTIFRSLGTLPQAAGVPLADLPRLIAKELGDNALDAGGLAEWGVDPEDSRVLYVQDAGPGIDGDDARIAEIFSLRPRLITSKLLRLPSRGALGNGLRVVTGAVVATGGRLVVATRGRRLLLRPNDDGTTTIEERLPWGASGTRIEVHLGEGLNFRMGSLAWLEDAERFAQGGDFYRGSSSPHWYDSDAFFELCRAAEGRSVRELVAELDGCSGAKAGKIAAGFQGRPASSLSRKECDDLLDAAREKARPVRPERLGAVGALPHLPEAYGKETGTITLGAGRGQHTATLPYVVEAWALKATKAKARICVNRTPVAGNVFTWLEKSEQAFSGCNASFKINAGRNPFQVWFNVTIPYMPITTSGKDPDLSYLWRGLGGAALKAIQRAKRQQAGRTGEKRSQKEIIFECIPQAAEKASGGGETRFSERQLFYAVRPYLKAELGDDFELDYGHFERVVTEYEEEIGEDIPGMYRDTRGTLYHPHEGRDIPLGTLMVESYTRPAWTFNKILYCEKEGFFPILKAARWPERNDCALATSKGFASRAVKDIFDLLGETEEPIAFYCVHDADGYGTRIYDKLQNATRARPGRRVEIVNLGLEPQEALEMELQVEGVSATRTISVGEYVSEKDRLWLQKHRVELNAMTSPQFLEWLDRKFAEANAPGKVLPPPRVIQQRLEEEAKERVREAVEGRILREAKAEEQVAAALKHLPKAVKAAMEGLPARVGQALEETPEAPWRAPVDEIAEEVADAVAEETGEESLAAE